VRTLDLLFGRRETPSSRTPSPLKAEMMRLMEEAMNEGLTAEERKQTIAMQAILRTSLASLSDDQIVKGIAMARNIISKLEQVSNASTIDQETVSRPNGENADSGDDGQWKDCAGETYFAGVKL
jgi:hypothetical protein